MKLELLPHQQEALDKMHNGCVLWGGVGSGKTIAALAYAKAKEPDRKIIVITTAKKRDSLDWIKEAAHLHIPPDDIVIESWNKIQSFIEHENFFFIFDEQRLVGSGAWVKSFYKIAKKNRWILLSATPGDTWSDYAPMFIANGWYKNITEFRREHAIYSRFTKYPKIERWVNEGRLQKYRKRLLVHMPMARHTVRHIHHIECDFDKDLLDVVRKRRWNIYTDEPIKNAAELYGVMRKVVSQDPSRTDAIKKLIVEHPKLIIFYNFNYELDMLRDLCTDLEAQFEEDEWQQRRLQPRKQHQLKSQQDLQSRPTPRSGHRQKKLREPQSHGRLLETEQTLLSQPPRSEDSWESKAQNDSSTVMVTTLPQMPAVASASEQSPNEGTSRHDMMQPDRKVKTDSRTSGNRTPTESRVTLADSGLKYFDWAEWNGHKHEPLPQSESWIYLVQYTSGSEGWNCTETDSMAFWSLTYSWKQFHQAQGRIDRLNTPYTDLHYYVLMTNSMAEKPVMAALDAKHDFQPR